MSFDATAWAVQQRTASPTAKLVLIVLAHHLNDKTGQCDPGNLLIAELAQCTDRSVNKSLRELEELKLIRVRRAPGMRSSYEINHRNEFGGEIISAPKKKTKPPNTVRGSTEKNCTSFSINKEGNKEKKQGGTSTKKTKGPEFDFSKWPEEPTPEQLASWVKIRKKKRMETTQGAVDLMGRHLSEAAGHGYTLAYCFEVIEFKSWASFKTEWLLNYENGSKPQGAPTRPAPIDTENTDWGESDDPFQASANGAGQENRQLDFGTVESH